MPTILVVDDDPSVREVLAAAFRFKGFEALAASEGRSALALAKVNAIEAALVDINMPGLDGFEVTKTLRAHAAASGCDLPVWMMTGRPGREAEKQALDAGAIALLAKPFDLRKLVVEIQQRVGAAKPQPEAIAPVAE